jgi:ADP-heptose:LPS heptosyltransferase
MFTELKAYKKSFLTELIKFIITFDYKIKNRLLNFIQNLLFNNKNILDAKKILIFRTGSLGDSVCAMPAISSIRKNFPDAEIDILTNAGSENLVSMGGLIEKSTFREIINYYGMSRKELFKYLKGTNYDIVIELPQNFTTFLRELRNIITFRSIGVKSAIGFEIRSTRFLPSYQQFLFFFTNERESLLKMLKKYGLINYGLNYLLAVNENIKQKIKNILETKNISLKEKNIAIVPGAKRQQNRWPLEYFEIVKNDLIEKGFNILLIGGADDAERAKHLEGKNVYNFCGELTPLETAEMLKYCVLTITNDTGPMHLSYAVGTPVAAIFSGRDYAGNWFPPDDGKNIVFRNFIPRCNKCFENECDNMCLKELTPQAILDKIITQHKLSSGVQGSKSMQDREDFVDDRK